MQFKALTLASLAVAPAPVFGIGCYSLWKQGTDYFSGYIISAVVPLNATAGTTQTKNFKCISGSQSSLSHCPSYDPSNCQQASAAWSDQGVCSGPLVAPPPTPQPTGASWYGKGCPEEWVDGASYEGGVLDVERTVSGQCTENLVRVRIAYFLTATQIIHAKWKRTEELKAPRVTWANVIATAE
ncbi:hypothetical protein ACHAWO_000122 [Cyclotella atomus]|uniref:Uncharacterized protein n=1 Tax=Cyclotella atomus TaxID=382360 RepID=A0ABD3QSX2_9STRA